MDKNTITDIVLKCTKYVYLGNHNETFYVNLDNPLDSELFFSDMDIVELIIHLEKELNYNFSDDFIYSWLYKSINQISNEIFKLLNQ